MSGEKVMRTWKGRSGISPAFGEVYPGKVVEMTPEQAESFKNDLEPVQVKTDQDQEEEKPKKSRR